MRFSVHVKVTAKARERSVKQGPNGILLVRTTEAPERGRANEDVVALLAAHFGVAKSDIILKSGHASNRKKFMVKG